MTHEVPVNKDTLFLSPDYPKSFVFDQSVADVFDNMLDRSIPFYDEIQRLIGRFCLEFATPNSTLYDLGCSTGTTLFLLHQILDKTIAFVGVDYAEAMLEKSREKLASVSSSRSLDLVQADLNTPFPFKNPSIVILNLVLQFLKRESRPKLLRDIYMALPKNGAVLLIEKVEPNDTVFSEMFTSVYHEFKHQNGYSKDEISRKHQALKNTLIPYSPQSNLSLLKEAGFQHCDVFFQWVNFVGIIVIK